MAKPTQRACSARCAGRAGQLRRHGLTLERFLAMHEEQGGLCLVCELPFTEKRYACVDHCHESGKVRGILCNACNRGIGLLGDDPARILKAAAYLA